MEVKKFESGIKEIMLVLSTQLNTVMQERGIETATLVRDTGISTTLINMIRRGEGNPSLSNTMKIARYFGLPLSHFIDPDFNSLNNLPKLNPIRVYNIDNPHFKSGSEQYIMTLKKEHYPDASFAIQLNDSRLEPMFNQGTIFIISDKNKTKAGDTVLIQTAHGNFLRKIYIKDETALFMSLGIQSEIEELTQYKIIGSVIGIQVGGRHKA
jgi:transcriptional regulator with XRE-family HTH domain